MSLLPASDDERERASVQLVLRLRLLPPLLLRSTLWLRLRLLPLLLRLRRRRGW